MKSSLEAIKTLGVLAVAAILLVIGLFVNRPPEATVDQDSPLNKPLFANFKDPTAAAQLRIVKYDEASDKVTEFEVARDAKSGQWRLPSEENYPADAETQVRDAATSLVDLQVVGVASDDPKDHAEYGVIEPNPEAAATGDGVGTLVAMQDGSFDSLASLIIGAEVKGMDKGRFVRVPGENRVYVVAIDPAVFTTEFVKWIEPDLLQLNTFDVDTIALDDYSLGFSMSPTGQLTVSFDPRADLTVRWNQEKGQWETVKFVTYGEDGEPRTAQLTGQESLDGPKLNQMKSSLDDLKIIAVSRKPKGLGADLRAQGDFLENRENYEDLLDRGFIPLRRPEGAELKCANGEMTVELKDGVKYLLRFGAETRVGTELGRYLFVSAEFDDSRIPQPDIEPLPVVDDPNAPNPERDRIQRENEKKLADWRDKKRQAELKVQDLNARFADWYYVISDEVYKQLRFSPAGVIELKEGTATEGDGIDAFRALEERGLKKKGEDAPAPPPGPPGFPPGFPGLGGPPGG